MSKRYKIETPLLKFKKDTNLSYRELAERINMDIFQFMQICNGSRLPYHGDQISKPIKKIMDYIGCSFDELFPQFDNIVNDKTNFDKTVLFSEYAHISSSDPSDIIEQNELAEKLYQFLLNNRDLEWTNKVITRIELQCETGIELSKVFNISRQRISQIQNKLKTLISKDLL